jgi:RimJ/RimL family protein N-acetyltransferase
VESDVQAETPAPIVNIEGEQIALGPARRDLLPLYQRWANDFEVTRTTGLAARVMTLEAEEAWLAAISSGESNVAFTIYERATWRPIGLCGLHDLDLRHRTAEFGLMIGAKECWGRGYGTEVSRLTLDYGFNVIGLHNIMLRVFASNGRAIRAYQRVGFREVGRRREAHRLGGRVQDVIWMDCLATEFESPLLQRLLAPEPPA